MLGDETAHTFADSEEVVLSPELLCSTFIGCSSIPNDIECGLIIFDHEGQGLPVMNTCAPSITFRNPKLYNVYAKFKEDMVMAIIGSMNHFGCV